MLHISLILYKQIRKGYPDTTDESCSFHFFMNPPTLNYSRIHAREKMNRCTYIRCSNLISKHSFVSLLSKVPLRNFTHASLSIKRHLHCRNLPTRLNIKNKTRLNEINFAARSTYSYVYVCTRWLERSMISYRL